MQVRHSGQLHQLAATPWPPKARLYPSSMRRACARYDHDAERTKRQALLWTWRLLSGAALRAPVSSAA